MEWCDFSGQSFVNDEEELDKWINDITLLLNDKQVNSWDKSAQHAFYLILVTFINQLEESLCDGATSSVHQRVKVTGDIYDCFKVRLLKQY